MKHWHVVFIALLLFGVGLLLWSKKEPLPAKTATKDTYVVTGSANPGEIILYKVEEGGLTEQKRVNTGYKFVFTVRIGDIYNTGVNSIIAGVGDSFYKDPYGCQVISYSINLDDKQQVDTVGDLRCKDLTIDDIENDGVTDIVLGTHGEGKIQIYRYIANKWQKEIVDHNYIAQVDELEGTLHRVPNDTLPCDECIVQSAVHIVKTADIDGVGEKEIIATISSPLELQNHDEISFVMLYRKVNGQWKREIIDRAINIEFRSIDLGDVDHNGRQDIIIGTGSPRDVPASLVAYEYTGQEWQKKEIFSDTEAKNMKGLAVTGFDGTGKDSIVLATGFPDSTLYKITWDGSTFESKELNRVSSIMEEIGEYNAMATIVLADSGDIITAGMVTFPDKKIGWEASDKGFVVYHTNKHGTFLPRLVNSSNILSMDYFKE